MLIIYQLLGLCLSVQSIYVLSSKNITVQAGEFYAISLHTQSDVANSQIIPSGNISFSKQYVDSGLFDVFVLYQPEELECYMEIYYNSSWEQTCFFLYHKSETHLGVQNFSYYYEQNISNQNITIIIDNTYFPLEGASFLDPLMLDVHYEQRVEPNSTYYQWTIKLLIVFVSVFICFSIWCIIMVYRYRKEKQKFSKQIVPKTNIQDYETKYKPNKQQKR